MNRRFIDAPPDPGAAERLFVALPYKKVSVAAIFYRIFPMMGIPTDSYSIIVYKKSPAIARDFHKIIQHFFRKYMIIYMFLDARRIILLNLQKWQRINIYIVAHA